MSNEIKKEFEGTKEKQQKLGAFYTPDELVSKMYEKLDMDKITEPILDPTCGYGNILIFGLNKKYQYYCKNLTKKEAAEKAFSEIYGIELDKEVLDTCKENLNKWALTTEADINIINNLIHLHFHLGDALNPMNYIFADTNEEQVELDNFKKVGLPVGMLYRSNKYYQILHGKKFKDDEIIKYIAEWRKA